MDVENKLETIIQKSGLELSQSQLILDEFQGYFDIAAQWELYCKSIVVKDENDKQAILAAKEGRKALSEKRIALEKTRVALKEKSKREGQCIDGIATVLKGLIGPIEAYLRSQEDFVEIKKERKRQELITYRLNLIKDYIPLPNFEYKFGEMTEEIFQILLAKKKQEHEDRKAFEAAQEAQRLTKLEAERLEKIRLYEENERLRKEAARHEAEIKAELDKQEAKAIKREAEMEAERIEQARKYAEVLAEERRKNDEALAEDYRKFRATEPQNNGNIALPLERITCPFCQKSILIRRKT